VVFYCGGGGGGLLEGGGVVLGCVEDTDEGGVELDPVGIGEVEEET